MVLRVVIVFINAVSLALYLSGDSAIILVMHFCNNSK